MKITSKLTTILTLCLFVAFSTQAQRRGGSPEELATKQTERMTDSLTLSTAQSTKIGEINLKYAMQISDLRIKARESEDFDRMAMRENMQKIREAQNSELKTVLTSDQFERFEKMEAKRRQRRDGRRGDQRGKKKNKESKNRS